jgi:hypothetical protein
MPIPDIRINIKDIDIREIDIPRSLTSESPLAIPIYPPVTTEIGIPIVNIPGCVEAHTDSDRNTNLKNEDDKGTMTLCDAGTPSYYPIDYDANKIKLEQEAPPPPAYKPPPKPEVPEAPAPKVPKTEAPVPECPTRAQQLKDPVGKILEGNKKIVAYETVGKECLPVFEELSIPDQIVQNIPSPGMVTTTASIAVVATSSALLAKPLADLLLRVVKPTVKKVIKKIAALRGKKTLQESVFERRQEQRVRNHAIRKLKGKE